MSLTEIQEAPANLTSAAPEELLHWLVQYKEGDWDRQITADAAQAKTSPRGIFKFRAWRDHDEWCRAGHETRLKSQANDRVPSTTSG